ncbi:MAG TPA: DSD1 family PLP-dependent enzyme [Solirubrobacteraceae bacterium]|nr:DSD1 family PLP-dependent enzyme [Solirubrobacteraceae bacterium]
MTAIRIDDLDTPCLAVDLDVFERNVRTCLGLLERVHVRPHLKTAKSPDVARLLLGAGAVGVCVAKLGEAEVMLAAGIEDVLITSEIAGSVKVSRLARLAGDRPAARVRIVVDSWEAAAAIDAALPRPLETLIDVNVGQDRCGIAPEDALALADRIRGLERLRLIGVQGYEGHLQHVRDQTERRALCDGAMGRLETAAGKLSAGGHTVQVVTTGGTGTAEFCAAHSFVTEVQPGSFAFMDTDYLDTGGLPYESSLHVIATVISRPAGDRAVTDAGLKTLSDDSGPARLLDAPGWTYHHAGDEHGKLTSGREAGRRELRVGDRVRLIPSHIDPTINLHDVMYAHRGGLVEAVWPVAARGKVQ